MALKSSELSQVIDIESQAVTANSSGGLTKGAWSTLLRTWARVRVISATSSLFQGQLSRDTSVLFDVRYDSRITGENQRVSFKGDTYSIVNVQDEDGLRADMTIIAEKD